MGDQKTLEARLFELREQVEALGRAGSTLHEAQRHLDAQLALFRKLCELGRRSAAHFDIPSLLGGITTFALHELHFQRCVIFLDDRGVGAFTVRAYDGYSEAEWPERFAQIALTKDDPLVAAAHTERRVVCDDDAKPACAVAQSVGVQRFIAFPLLSDEEELLGLLLAGVRRGEEKLYVEVARVGDAAYGLANLAAQASASITHCLRVRALAEERDRLDETVRRRTEELSEARAALARLDGPLSGLDAGSRRAPPTEFETEDDVLDDDDAEVVPESSPSGPVSARGRVLASLAVAEETTEGAAVLVVDDEPGRRRFFASVLRPHFRVQMARDGLEALDKLRRFSPDLVIADVTMSRMSGTELCAAVRAEPAPLGQTPFLFVTERAVSAVTFDRLSSGANDFLVTPFAVAELMCRAKNLVTLRKKEIRLSRALSELAHVHVELKDQDDRLHNDLREACAFQQRLLPKLPVVDDLCFQTVYRPLDMVGGDIFDVLKMGEHSYRLFLADVTGHGVQAALRTMTLKAEYDRVRASPDGPASVLVRLNRNIARSYSPLELLCTACCFDLERVAGGGYRVLIASAAHPPLIHVTGAVWREVLGNGTFLGTPNAEIQLDTREVFLEPGDRLAAFTDGLCEQGGEGVVGCFDISRIGEALLSGGQRLPDAIDTLMLRFDAFRASRRVTDDLTVLAIECGPLGGAVTHR